jgi:threonine/homoserine/homoserine lactone efflux protein
LADDPHNISTALAVALREGLAAGDRGAAAASEALTHGYTTGFLVGAGMLLVAAVVAMAAVNTRRTQNAAADRKG